MLEGMDVAVRISLQQQTSLDLEKEITMVWDGETDVEHDPLTVLIVDDEPAVRKTARRIFESAGCDVLEACDGLEALSAVNDAARLDLLVADFLMPSLNGEEMARRFRKVRPDLKVLYVTGCVDQLFTEREVLWAGEAFLEKPFNRAGLLEAASLLLFDRVNGIPA